MQGIIKLSEKGYEILTFCNASVKLHIWMSKMIEKPLFKSQSITAKD